MIISLQTWARRGTYTLRKLALDARVQLWGRAAAYFLAGFGLSAASLAHRPMPLAMGLVCACSGWAAALATAGGALGYLTFWGDAGQQGVLWVVLAFLLTLLPEKRRELPLLIPAAAGLAVSAAGVIFQVWLQDTSPVGVYLLRIALAIASAWLFGRTLRGRNPIVDWLSCGLAVLALAQITPLPYLNLGFIAVGALAVMGAFPAAALAGLALDLANTTPVAMTAVACGGYLIRFLPRYPKWMGALAPGAVYLLVMVLGEQRFLYPLPGVLLGGVMGLFLPSPAKLPHRRGETGGAQVRLEVAAGVLIQTEHLLLETPEVPVDEDALVTVAAEQACSGCPCRRNCRDSKKLIQLPAAVLHKPLLTAEELPVICRKSGRFLAQLHHSQERLRSIRADRERQREYRAAVIQQYQFLSAFLQDLSDGLAQRTQSVQVLYEPWVRVYGNRPETENGDRCIKFSGTGCRYFVLMCDGMGTGLGAVQESRRAAELLRSLLKAGFPAEYALRSLNSLCALRGRAGAVTVELLELRLDTGKASLYKWGAPPSYLVSAYGAEKIGTTGPPPGLSVTDAREGVYRLSLRRGETLVLVSDGVGEEEALHCCLHMTDRTPGELAASLLARSQLGGEDDATVVLVHLGPAQV